MLEELFSPLHQGMQPTWTGLGPVPCKPFLSGPPYLSSLGLLGPISCKHLPRKKPFIHPTCSPQLTVQSTALLWALLQWFSHTISNCVKKENSKTSTDPGFAGGLHTAGKSSKCPELSRCHHWHLGWSFCQCVMWPRQCPPVPPPRQTGWVGPRWCPGQHRQRVRQVAG